MKPWSTSAAPGPGWVEGERLVVPEDVVEQRDRDARSRARRRAAWPGTAGRWPRRPGPRRAGRRREFSATPVETLFATVLLTIATFAESSSVIGAADVGRPVVDDHVVADVDPARSARSARRCRRRRRRSSCSGSGCGRYRPSRCRRRAGRPPIGCSSGSRCRRRSRPRRCSRSGCRGSSRPGSAPVGDAGAVLDAEVRADDAAGDLVVVRAVEDADAAGAGEPAVADQPVVGDADAAVVVAAWSLVRLADADAAGEDAAVVLEHVVGQLDVVRVGLQLDAAGARRRCPVDRPMPSMRAAPRHAGDPPPGRRRPCRLGEDGEVGARAAPGAPRRRRTYGACGATRRVEGLVVLEEARRRSTEPLT